MMRVKSCVYCCVYCNFWHVLYAVMDALAQPESWKVLCQCRNEASLSVWWWCGPNLVDKIFRSRKKLFLEKIQDGGKSVTLWIQLVLTSGLILDIKFTNYHQNFFSKFDPMVALENWQNLPEIRSEYSINPPESGQQFSLHYTEGFYGLLQKNMYTNKQKQTK